MSGAAGENDEARQAKREEFLFVARSSVQTAVQSIVERDRLFPIDPLEAASLAASLLADALAVAQRIPRRLSALDAARDFIAYATDPGRHWDDPPERPIPARWMGLEEQTIVQGYVTDVFELIDGRWQIENSAWRKLDQFDDGATLRVLTHVLSAGPSTIGRLRKALPAHLKSRLPTVLETVERDGWVARSGEGDETLFAATLKLREAADPALARLNAMSDPAEHAVKRDLAAEWAKAKEERLRKLPDTPDARIVLKALDRGKRLATRELTALLSHPDRSATVRLLQRLREAGWVATLGEGRATVWLRTDKRRGPVRAKSAEGQDAPTETKPAVGSGAENEPTRSALPELAHLTGPHWRHTGSGVEWVD